MSGQPDYLAPEPDDNGIVADIVEVVPVVEALPNTTAEANWQADASALIEPNVEPASIGPALIEPGSEPESERPSDTLFAWYNQPPVLPPARIPNLGDVSIVTLMLGAGWIGSGALLAIALHFHVLGVSTIKQALADVRYTLGSQAAWYIIAFGGAALLFPALWQKGFWAGLQWNGIRALHLRWRLIAAAAACFMLALVDGVLMPGPSNTPIDQIFRMPGAAWILFGFGITLAPLFEEIAFRGFLLPALCTAYDWISERFTGTLPRWPDENGHPRWSLRAMIVSSFVTSVPFALMHAEQTGYSLGPFLLLVCVSLALCWVRLSTRSLAASVMVHSSYNFLLFSLMLAGTNGFRHLDKM